MNTEQTKQSFLFNFYDALFAPVLNDEDQKLTKAITDLTASLTALEASVDEATNLLEQLDVGDLISSSVHSAYAQRFKGVV